MRLKAYWNGLTADARASLAEAAGTTFGHLRNVAYGSRSCDPALAVALERLTDGAVRRWDLRPEDWHAIWPELIDTDGAPDVKAAA